MNLCVPGAASSKFRALVVLGTCFVVAVVKSLGALSDDPHNPQQVHINLASSRITEAGTYALTVSWATLTDAESTLVYWAAGSKEKYYSTGKSSRYEFDGIYRSPYLHEATMIDLQPGETYWYSCGDAITLSEPVFVVMPPAVGDGSSSYTIAIAGDIGQTSDSSITFDHILEEPTPLILLHLGDLSYADCESSRWDTYEKLAEKAASRIPWMTVAGNHEIEIELSTGKTFTAYESRYKMPAVKAAEFDDSLFLERGAMYGIPNYQMSVKLGTTVATWMLPIIARSQDAVLGQIYGDSFDCTPSEWLGSYDFGSSFYSFDVATTHVIALNPYTSTAPDSKQYKWLVEDLAAVDRAITPWIIIMMHCPWYNSNFHHQMEYQTIVMKEAMESLVNEAKVAIIFSGHVHAYERTYPVSNWRRKDGAPVFIVVGDGGNREGHAVGFLSKPHWSAARDDTTFGHGRLTVMNDTHAMFDWRRNVEGSPESGDVAWIVNPWTV